MDEFVDEIAVENTSSEEPNEESKPKKKRGKRKDPMAPKPGRRAGSTALHKILSPSHLEEVREQLAWDSLESVQAYIVQMGYVDEEGRPLISLSQLKYYRWRFVSAEERLGYARLCRLLKKYRVRLPPIAAQETVISIQLQRLEAALEEEKNIGTTVRQVSGDIDLLDRLIGRLYTMKKETGLIPLVVPTQRYQVQADVSQVSATVQQQVPEDAPLSKVKETLDKFKQFLKDEAVKAEEDCV